MTSAFDKTDLLAPQNVVDPYPALAELREQQPVTWSAAQRGWLVLRHEDVTSLLMDPRLSSDRIGPIFDSKLTAEQQRERKPTYDLLKNWVVFNDPPKHTRLRRLIRPAFTPAALARWETRIEQIVDSCLDRLRDRTEVELISEFSYAIPALVIAEMMGVPAEDLGKFERWSDSLMTIVFGAAREPGVREAAQAGLLELRDYLAHLIDRYRSDPGDNIISALIRAEEVDGQLTNEEIVSTCTLLMFGGHETTTNLIGNGTRSLIMNRGQMNWLRENPDQMVTAVEELLRFDGPSKLEVRHCVAAIELRGQYIAPGDKVYLVQLAANRDAAVFDDPDSLNLQRKPNRHVGFGFGIHFCLGAPVARLEARIALSRLIHRYPDMELGASDAVWHPTLVGRGMSSFPVSLRGR